MSLFNRPADSSRRQDRALRPVWLALLVQVAIGAFGLWTIVYLIARLLDDDLTGPLAATHNLTPWFGPFGVVLLLGALFFRARWVLVGLLLPALIAFMYWYLPMLLPQTVDAPASGQRLTVVAFNILSPASEPDRIVDVLQDLNDADIIGLNELGPEHAQQIEQALGDTFTTVELHPREPTNNGVGLLARYPLLAFETFQPLENSMLHIRAVLDIGGREVVVYVVHPYPPKNRTNPLRYDATLRNRELAQVRARVAEETQPTLLLCDCNMPDKSQAYRDMDRLLDDAFRVAGEGFGFTFPAYRDFLPSTLRIDYVWFSSAHFTALRARTIDEPGTSDHRPVAADLVLAPAP